MIASIYNCYTFYKNEGELDTAYLMSLTDDYEPDEDKLLHIAGIQEGYIEDYFEYLKQLAVWSSTIPTACINA